MQSSTRVHHRYNCNTAWPGAEMALPVYVILAEVGPKVWRISIGGMESNWSPSSGHATYTAGTSLKAITNC
jgi:hypothetical protein